MTSFDPYADSYREDVADSIAFARIDHRYVTEHKVFHLLSLCESLIGPAENQRLLDVGCGVGVTDTLLADRVGSLYGIDISADSIARAATTNPSAQYSSYDGVTFPLDDASVDMAFAICVLHHVPPDKRTRFAGELQRVLRPGGIAVIFEHNPFNPLTREAVNRCEFDEGVTLARRGAAARLLTGVGLRVVESSYILFTRSPRWAKRSDHLLGWCPAGAQYYVAARCGS
jgi:ubiquinone/menaquinone biosynthesis C-methylase UbiE